LTAFTQLLRLRARLEMADARLDDAVRTVQTGFSLARHAAESPDQISCVIACGIASGMALEVEEFVQLPGSPNLYWALSDLPRPMIDLRKALQMERLWAGLVPDLRDTKLGPLSRPQVESLAGQLDRLLSGGFKPVQGDMRKWFLSFKQDEVPAQAKKALIAAGRNAQQLDAMPPLQVWVLYQLHEFDRYYDEILKGQSLPYWQARPHWQRLKAQIKVEIKPGAAMSLVWVGLTPVEKVVFASVRVERHLAALRCIEAIRLYAAGHGGQVPQKLADITEVPVPIDPVTGQDFEYKVEGRQIRLSAPPPPGEQPRFRANMLQYELTVAAK
jgi:hypothetical protein